MKQISAKILALFTAMLLGAQVQAQDNLNLQTMLQPIDSNALMISDSFYTWCTSVITGDDGKYHMFYSRWAHGQQKQDDDPMNYIFNGFRGWCKYSEIAYAVADEINGPYRYVSTVLKGNGSPTSWDRFTMHNPQIRKFGSYYYLYYISNAYDSTLQFPGQVQKGKDWIHWLQYNCTQKIGVIKAKSIADLVSGRYEKPAAPLVVPDNINTFEVATNPTVTQGPDGRYYMMYKSRKPNVGNMTFWMAVSHRPDGEFKMLGEVFTSAEMACEDPCMWYDKKRKRFYAAAKYYSNSKLLSPQFGSLVLLSSEDGMKWKPAKHTLISLRELHWINGTTTPLAHLERPFVVTNINGQPLALCAAASIKEPSQNNASRLDADHNSFGVVIGLK